LADEIKTELGIEAKTEIGAPASFDVIVDGVLIFSKSDEERFPFPGEVADRIRKYLAENTPE
jgi:hypothetical protein